MKHYVTLCIALMLSVSLWAKSERETVIFDVDIHCQNCITKVEKNIAFEPGVKDLSCNLDDKTVTVTFDPAKTNTQRLIKAFAKINKHAKVHGTTADVEKDSYKEHNDDVDAQTGASTRE